MCFVIVFVAECAVRCAVYECACPKVQELSCYCYFFIYTGTIAKPLNYLSALPAVRTRHRFGPGSFRTC